MKKYICLLLNKSSQSNYNCEGAHFSVSRMHGRENFLSLVSRIVVSHFRFSFVGGIIRISPCITIFDALCIRAFEFCRDSCTFNAFVSCITGFEVIR